MEFPDSLIVVPLGVLDLVAEFDVFIDEVILLVYVLEVFVDLW